MSTYYKMEEISADPRECMWCRMPLARCWMIRSAGSMLQPVRMCCGKCDHPPGLNGYEVPTGDALKQQVVEIIRRSRVDNAEALAQGLDQVFSDAAEAKRHLPWLNFPRRSGKTDWMEQITEFARANGGVINPDNPYVEPGYIERLRAQIDDMAERWWRISAAPLPKDPPE